MLTEIISRRRKKKNVSFKDNKEQCCQVAEVPSDDDTDISELPLLKSLVFVSFSNTASCQF